MDRPTKYRELLSLAGKYGVYEDAKRAKGSERLWIRELPDGTKRSIPVTCHGSGYVIGVGLSALLEDGFGSPRNMVFLMRNFTQKNRTRIVQISADQKCG